MTIQANDSGSFEQNAQSDPGEKRPSPHRRIMVTAILAGLVALGFYAAEIMVVAFSMAGH